MCTARCILGQIVDGLLVLHNNNIMHRDISMGNVLLSRDRQNNLQAVSGMDVSYDAVFALVLFKMSYLEFGKHCSESGFLLGEIMMVAWHSGRTSVFDRRTFPVLRSSYS